MVVISDPYHAFSYEMQRLQDNHLEAHFEPITIRLPRTGARCPWTGLTRSTLNDLVLPNKSNNFNPAVKSRLLKAKGAARGVRLIDFASLKEYLLTSEELSPRSN